MSASTILKPNTANPLPASLVETTIRNASGKLVEFRTSDGKLEDGQLVGIYFDNSGEKQLVYADKAIAFKDIVDGSILIVDKPQLIPDYIPESPFIAEAGSMTTDQLIQERLGLSASINLQNATCSFDALREEFFEFCRKNPASVIELTLLDRRRLECRQITFDDHDKLQLHATLTDGSTITLKIPEVDDFVVKR